jgi:hypothetical protein
MGIPGVHTGKISFPMHYLLMFVLKMKLMFFAGHLYKFRITWMAVEE